MLYKITLRMQADDIGELENILDRYDIDYEIDEVYESEVV